MVGLFEKVKEAADHILSAASDPPLVGIVLGTGLGNVADIIEIRQTVPYADIPHFAASTVESHSGRLILGTVHGVPVAAMQGRFHYYEGWSLDRVTFPVRALRAAGARTLIINSAAGGLDPRFEAGDVMAVRDHLNLMGVNPLRGMADERLGERFPDMTEAYDAELLARATEAAMDRKIPLKHGVYVGVTGPSLETPAETRMLRMLGGDAVGMSTIPEVIVGVAVGFRILTLAAITNVNLPDCMKPVAIETVIANAGIAAPKMAAIVEDVISGLGR